MSKHRSHPNHTINSAIIFATQYHSTQVRKGIEDLPYIFHPIGVAEEVLYHSNFSHEDTIKAAVLGILHDTVEDTDATVEDILITFGAEMRDAVSALSKDPSIRNDSSISKERSLRENIGRIKQQPLWVWAVKIADRISNLKVFPNFWSREKIEQYLIESKIIADELSEASEGLHARLLTRIQIARTILAIRS